MEVHVVLMDVWTIFQMKVIKIVSQLRINDGESFDCDSDKVCGLISDGSIPLGILLAYQKEYRISITVECSRLRDLKSEDPEERGNAKIALSRVRLFSVITSQFYEAFNSNLIDVYEHGSLSDVAALETAVTEVMRKTLSEIKQMQESGENFHDLRVRMSLMSDSANLLGIGKPWSEYE